MKEITFSKKLFGDFINIMVYIPDMPEKSLDLNEKEIKDVLEETYLEALRLQKIFNFFDSESELSELNKKGELNVSQDLLNVIKNALKFSELTKGKYDITLGKNILQRKNKEPLKKINSSYKDVKINGNKIKLNHEDALIDLGSIAKGYITDKIKEFLLSKGINEFMIDSRGDIILSGDYSHVIGIQDPRNKNKNVLSVKLQNEAIATSGDYRQFDKSFKKSHILNSNNIISVTVVAPTLEEADVYATSIFVSDEKNLKRIIKSNPKIKIMLLRENLKPIMYNKFEELIYEK